MPDIPSLDWTRRVCAGDAFLHGVPRLAGVGHPPANARLRVGCPSKQIRVKFDGDEYKLKPVIL